MSVSPPASAAFRYYAWIVVAMAVLLIWWGAAVTTENVGMAVPGWPLMFGQTNPQGWWKHLPFFLEHGHRLIAATVGVLTLMMFAWRFLPGGRHVLEFGLLLAVVAVTMEALLKGLYPLVFAGCVAGFSWLISAVIRRNWPVLELVGLVFFLAFLMKAVHANWHLLTLLGTLACAGWLFWGWTGRNWPLLTKLSALALLLVSLQAALGGVRVLQVSDHFGVLHGCLAQVFFCLLILIALASSPAWNRPGIVQMRWIYPLRWWAMAMVGAVFLQLIFGASMRHHHRIGLVDDHILTTGGSWFPGFGDVDLLILFLHKWWAVVVLLTIVSMSIWALRSRLEAPGLKRLILTVAVLVLVQLSLGVGVLVTGKSFWVTNFHVLNGLAILATSFILLVKSLRAQPGSILLAGQEGSAAWGRAAA